MTNEELAVRIQRGENDLLPVLWEQVYRLMQKFSLNYYNSKADLCASCGITYDDLIQECYFALSDIVAAYDEAKSFQLTTYFKYHLQTKFNCLTGQRTAKGRNEHLNHSVSLDAPASNENECTIKDTIPDKTELTSFQSVEHAIFIQQLHEALEQIMKDCLTDEQQKIIHEYYYQNHTFEEIALARGISTERARQIEQNALYMLRIQEYARELKEAYSRAFCFAYRGSLSSFQNQQGSSTELAIEQVEEFKEQWQKARKLYDMDESACGNPFYNNKRSKYHEQNNHKRTTTFITSAYTIQRNSESRTKSEHHASKRRLAISARNNHYTKEIRTSSSVAGQQIHN